MRMLVGSTCLTIALAASASPALAQNWAYEPDTVVSRPIDLAPVQRTTTYRTIIPQSGGRAPIVRERVVSETYAAVPPMRERAIVRAPEVEYRTVARPAEVVVRRPAEVDYAYVPTTVDDYAYGARASRAYALAPVSEPTVTVVPDRWSYDRWSYRYRDDRRLVVDPVTGAVIEQWRW